jgi:hypothetical protein
MPQNNKNQVTDRRNKIAQYYFEGKKQFEMATLLSVSEGQISQDLKHLRVVWQKRAFDSIDVKIAEELAKIDNLERELWEAWDKSRTDHTKTMNKAKGKANSVNPDYKEITETEVIKDGEPRFLQGVERCIERRCKLLGLDAPSKIEAKVDEHSFLHFLMYVK